MPKTIILWLADLHSGSTVSLYPDKTLHLMNGPRGPSALQKKIYKQWVEVLEKVARLRQDADRLVVVNMGDTVEGDHHHTLEVMSGYLTDHQTIHMELMRQCKEITQYDTLYYVNGTEVHDGEDEYDIAEKLKAELYQPGKATHPTLRKKIYKRLIFAAHHGPGAGRGWAGGNALRNNLKILDYEQRVNGEKVPDMVVYAHRHVHRHEQIEIGGHKIDGYILPSWKLLDGYTNSVAPFAFNNIGAMISICTESGIVSEFVTIHIDQDKIGEL